MSESTPSPAPQEPQPNPSAENNPPPATPPVKRKRRRRWPWVLGAIALLLILLVLLAPTIVSMGWARAIVVSQVNQRLNGHIEIKDWSLGWAKGIGLDGLVVYDDAERQILQLPHLSTQLTLASLLRGKYDAGKVEVDGLDVLVVCEPDGSLNWDKIAKQSSKNSEPSSKQGTSASKQSKLPDVRADVVVNSANITYEDRRKNQTLHLRSLNAEVNIPDINQPIRNTLTAQAQVNDGPPGTISLAGSVDAVKNNQVAVDTASVDETLKLQGVHMGAVSALLGDKLKMQLAGNTNAQVVVQLKNGTDGAIQASLVSSGFGASGESLGGGVLHSDALTFNLPKTSIRAPHGLNDLKSLQVAIGNSQADVLALQLKNASVAQGEGPAARQVLNNYTLDFATALNYGSTEQGSALAATAFDLHDNQRILQAVIPAGQNISVTLPAKGEPQASGTLHVAADLARLNSIAKALSGPQVAAQEQSGADLRSGKLSGDISLAQAGPQQIQINGNIGIDQITVASASATPIQNEKIQLTLKLLANNDLSQVDVPQLDATGDILQAHADNTTLKLSNGSGAQAAPVPMFEKIQKVSLRIEVPSLPKIQALMRAWSPPQKATARRVDRAVPGSEMAQAGRGPARGALPANAPPASTQPAPLPPADITSGSAVVTLNGGFEAGKLHLAPGATISNLSFKRGQYASNVGNIELKLDATITPAPAGSDATVTQQIGQLQVAQLDANAVQLNSSVSLVQPIVLNNPGALSELFSRTGSGTAKSAPASASGRILLRGDPGPIMAVKDAWSAQASEHQYGGGYAIDEQFATNPSGQITAVGRADLNELTIDGQPYPERALRILSNVSLDSRNEVLGIDNVSILSTTTNAINLTLKGRMFDLANQRRIDNVLTADLSYDGAALWKMIVPLLSKETQQSAKDYIVAGKYQKQLQIRGSYPANKPFNEAVRSLSISGDVVLDQFAARGADLRNLSVPINLQGGVLRIAYAGKPQGQDVPPPATLNGGTISIGGISADLRQDHIRYSTPPNLKFIDHVTLNPIFASTYLGDLLNNPVFVGAQQATGVLNVNISRCEGLALDDAMKTAQSGTAVLDLSLSELHVGNDLIAKILSIAGVSELKNSLQGDVKSYHVEISQGTLKQDMTLTLAESNRPLRVFGNVRLADNEMEPMTIDFPWALFAVGKNTELKKYLPEGVQIPLRGKPGSPSFGVDINQLVQKTLVQAGQKALQENLIKGVTGQKGGSTTQPSDQNPLQQLEDLLNQGKKDKKKK